MSSFYPISRILKRFFVPADLKRRLDAAFEALERQVDPSASTTALSAVNDAGLPDGAAKFIPGAGLFYLDRSGSSPDGVNTFATSSGNGVWTRDMSTVTETGEVLTDGAYREVLPAGQAFYTSATWYTSPAKTQKIREELITRDGMGLPTIVTTNVYDSTGTLVITLTDTITYINNVEATRNRTVVRP